VKSPVIQAEDHTIKQPTQGPYPELIRDVAYIASLEEAIKGIADTEARQALQGGISTAIKALQKRVGDEVTIREE
jgi:hypothetical protein